MRMKKGKKMGGKRGGGKERGNLGGNSKEKLDKI